MKAPTAQRNEWEVVEGDNGNILVVTLTDDGTPVDLTGCKVLAVFGLPTGETVEQDTQDAYVNMDDMGITLTGTPVADDTVTVTVTGGSCSASVSGTGVTAATVNDEAFLERYPENGTYVFKYTTAWQYGDNSVTVGGTDHNEITINLKTGSFSPGKSSSGLMKCEIQVYSGQDYETLVTSAQFTFRCRRAIVNDETVPSDNNYPILVELIHSVQGFVRSNQSDWNQTNQDAPNFILHKPTSMTPSSHTHGNITNAGAITSDTTAASGDKLVLTDASNSSKLIRSGIAFGSATNTWLRNDRTWAAPTASDVGALATGLKGATDGVAELDSNVALPKVKAEQASAGIMSISVATYTLQLADAGKFLDVTNGGNVTITIPLNASVAFPAGTEIEICRDTSYTVTVAGVSGVTIKSAGSKTTIATQYGCAVLKRLGTDVWLLAGDLK